VGLLYEKFLERGKFVEFRQNLMFGQTIIDPNAEMGEGRDVGYIGYAINGGRPPEAERGELVGRGSKGQCESSAIFTAKQSIERHAHEAELRKNVKGDVH
jgi:hypothetical protein